MTNEEAIKEAEVQIGVYENMILYNKDFEPKNDNSNYERKIEFLRIAIEVLKKQIPKIPHLVYDAWICPSCGRHYEIDYDHYVYCPECGQLIDWSTLE